MCAMLCVSYMWQRAHTCGGGRDVDQMAVDLRKVKERSTALIAPVYAALCPKSQTDFNST